MGTLALKTSLQIQIAASCAAVGTLANIIQQIPLNPVTLNPGAAPAWVTVSFNIPAILLANTRLVFVANSIIGGVVPRLFDVGLDNVVITCLQTPLIPEFTVTDNGNGTFTFNGSTNVVPGVGVALWCWNFGDGSTGVGQTVTHTYDQPGTYQVCLTIADNCGDVPVQYVTTSLPPMIVALAPNNP